MVKVVKVVDDSDLPILGLVYSSEARVVVSSFSFESGKRVRARLKSGVELAKRRGFTFSWARSSGIRSEAEVLLSRVRDALSNELVRLSLIDRLDFSFITDFEKRVYFTVLKIPMGETWTYGDVSAELGTSPRAVGQALARNPFSPIIPCHRIIRSDGSLGGFSGTLNARDKAMMIAFEREVADEIEREINTEWRM